VVFIFIFTSYFYVWLDTGKQNSQIGLCIQSVSVFCFCRCGIRDPILQKRVLGKGISSRIARLDKALFSEAKHNLVCEILRLKVIFLSSEMKTI
jgi:hypothetical protein